MLQPLLDSPAFRQTAARFEAWWIGRLIDRPPVTLRVKPSRPLVAPVSTHDSLEQRWLDAEYNVELAIAQMQRRDWTGDAFPAYSPNIGPEITATLFGCRLEFTEETSWSAPIIEDVSQWRSLRERAPDFDNPYWQAMERMTRLAIERCEGRYIVGITDLHGNYDILAALRDPQALCTDLMDDPVAVSLAAMYVPRAFNQAIGRCWQPIQAAGMGATTWLPMYHHRLAYVPSCDFWCLLSSEMARDLVLPSILMEMQLLSRSIFHLDGPDALRHLDLLLELPQLTAVQWVQGAGNGPAAAWVDVYRRCIAAGKSVQVLAADGRDALKVLEALGPRRVWLTIEQEFEDVEQAEAFLREVQRLSRSSRDG